MGQIAAPKSLAILIVTLVIIQAWGIHFESPGTTSALQFRNSPDPRGSPRPVSAESTSSATQLGLARTSIETNSTSDVWGEICSGSLTFPRCPNATTPGAVSGYGLAYDAKDGYVVLFGGMVESSSGPAPDSNSTWIFRNGTWTNITADSPTHPSARENPGMTYDALDGYVLLTGGVHTNNRTWFFDVWTFTGGNWTNITNNSSQEPSAFGMAWVGLVYDSVDGYVVLVDTTTILCVPVSCLNQTIHTWSYAHGIWKEFPGPTDFPPTTYPALAYDPLDGYVVYFGGRETWTNYGAKCVYLFDDNCGDTWVFRSGNWSRVATWQQPSPRQSAAMSFDPLVGAVVLAGGLTCGFSCASDDTWLYRGGNWVNATNASLPFPEAQGGTLTLVTSTLVFDAADKYLVQVNITDSGTNKTSQTWGYGLASQFPTSLRTLGIIQSPPTIAIPIGTNLRFEAIVTCTYGYCPPQVTYRWSTGPSPPLGTLNTTTGNTVLFSAGNVSGFAWMTVSATLGNFTKTYQDLPFQIYSVVTSVSILPSSANLSTGGSENLTVVSICNGGPCPTDLAYTWAAQNSLVSLRVNDSATITAIGGPVTGTDIVSVTVINPGVNKTQNASVIIRVVPGLASVSINPLFSTVSPGGEVILTPEPRCEGGPCPPIIEYKWSAQGTTGSLNATVGSPVTFKANDLQGSSTVTVVAYLNGTVVTGYSHIQVSGSPKNTNLALPPNVVYVFLVAVMAGSVAILLTNSLRPKSGGAQSSSSR